MTITHIIRNEVLVEKEPPPPLHEMNGRAVLYMAKRGDAPSEIADHLGISIRGVRRQIKWLKRYGGLA